MSRASLRSCCGWLVLCVALFACSENPSTGVLVSIHAGDKVALNVNRVQVLLYAEERNEGKPVEDRPFYLAASQPAHGDEVTFPFSFVILKGRAQRFRLVVKGYGADSSEPVIERKLIASFRDGHTEVLRVVLADICYERPAQCLAFDQTCYPLESEGVMAGACGPAPDVETEPVMPRNELDATIAQATGRDAGTELDAEVERDAGLPPDGDESPLDAGASNVPDVREPALDGGADGPDVREPPPDSRDGGANTSDGRTGADGCVDGQVGNGAGGCVSDPCVPQPCQHGGRCSAMAGAFRCDCTGTGFEGPTCSTNINECDGPNVCAGTRNGLMFSYPCHDYRGDQVGYSCPGMFSDWPLTSPSNRFTESPTGVIRDARTGLEWQLAVDPLDRTLAAARDYCTNLPLPGGRFRLPTRAELDTITDMTVPQPSAIDQVAFPGTPGLMFWTSSPHVGMAGFQWVVHFVNGSFHSQPSATAAVRVRCVRSPQGGP